MGGHHHFGLIPKFRCFFDWKASLRKERKIERKGERTAPPPSLKRRRTGEEGEYTTNENVRREMQKTPQEKRESTGDAMHGPRTKKPRIEKIIPNIRNIRDMRGSEKGQGDHQQDGHHGEELDTKGDAHCQGNRDHNHQDGHSGDEGVRGVEDVQDGHHGENAEAKGDVHCTPQGRKRQSP